MASRGSLSTEARLSTPFVVAIAASGTWVNRREKCFVGTSRLLVSVCTGALLCGAAGGLVGRQVTTHRSARHLMWYYGAVLVDARVAVNDNIISAAGVTAGLDAALALVSLCEETRRLKRSSLPLSMRRTPSVTLELPRMRQPRYWRDSRRSTSRSGGIRASSGGMHNRTF